MVRTARAAVVGVVIAMLAAACTDDRSESRPSETSSAPATSTLDRFELAARPLWRGDADGLPEIMSRATFLNDVLLLEQATKPMAAVDPTTGTPYWTADEQLLVGNEPKYGDVEVTNSAGHAPVVRMENEWVLFVSYVENAEAESSIAALRLQDASPLWKVPPPGPFDIVDANDRVVLLLKTPSLDQHMVHVISASNGSTMWETPDIWPHSVAGDRVLGMVSAHPSGVVPYEASYVVGLDATTGQRLWSLESRYQRSEIGLVAGDLALVYVWPKPDGPIREAGAGRDSVVLIDVASGAEVANLGWDFGGRNSCATDDHRIACTLDADRNVSTGKSARLVTFDVARRAKHVSPEERQDELSESFVTRVWGDYIFVRDTSVIRGDMWAVDRDGVVVSDKLPGTLIGISDEYAVFTPPAGGVATVYKIGE